MNEQINALLCAEAEVNETYSSLQGASLVLLLNMYTYQIQHIQKQVLPLLMKLDHAPFPYFL